METTRTAEPSDVPATPQTRGDSPRPRGRTFWRAMLALIGIALPIYTLLFELLTNICGQSFFDPVPTIWHALLIALVPFANLLAFRASCARRPWTNRVGMLLGAALVVSSIYTLLFVTIMPITMVYTLMGALLGGLLLPLTIHPAVPLLSLIATSLLVRRYLAYGRESGRRTVRPALVGGMLALFCVVILEGPKTATRVLLERYLDDSSDTRALAMLRSVGDERTLLRAAYGELLPRNDFLGWLSAGTFHFFDELRSMTALPVEQSRDAYYRITGKSFSAEPYRSARSRAPGFLWLVASEHGADRVGGRAEGVELVSSTIDGSIDVKSATSYTEWTMIVTNRSRANEEARAEVLLPAGGYVTRATLWINGEEREAAFGGRAQVRQAYERVVRGTRDPLLVTTLGRDRVLVQCFPIPPDGGEMKIRIGITAPLTVGRNEPPTLVLPSIVDANFKAAHGLADAVWMEAGARIESQEPDLVPAVIEAGRFSLRGGRVFRWGAATEVSVAEAGVEPISVARNFETGQLVRQRFDERTRPAVTNIAIVVDGSVSLAKRREDVSHIIESLPTGMNVSAIVAGDEIVPISPGFKVGNTDVLREIGHAARDYRYTGGADNGTALRRAWDLLSGRPNSAVLWIHGPQPVKLRSAESLAQLERRLGSGRPAAIISIELVTGADRLSGVISPSTTLETVRGAELRKEEIARRVNRLLEQRTELVPVREQAPASEDENAPTATDHIVRLWAAAAVEDAIKRGGSAVKQAVELAVDYRLVTAVSGAVVLETSADYQQAGLTEPTENTPQPQHVSLGKGLFPVAPEPSIGAMALMMAAMLMLFAAARSAAVRLQLLKR